MRTWLQTAIGWQKNAWGAHQATAMYAAAVLGSSEGKEHVAALDRLRRNRNRSEYGLWTIGSATVARDLTTHAHGIVGEVENDF